jgi:membrane protein YdbS with pleckstrin-like domain
MGAICWIAPSLSFRSVSWSACRGAKKLDAQESEPSGAGSRRATKAIVAALAVIALVMVLTWAVSVFFEIAIIKSLAAVILVLFIVVIALFVAGVA